ncbi:MAG: hypothetical protein K0U93_08290 [Gammaproteobacteria bacterium]|nr:hypothetical protein [Gammaproteobacteria bacterium]
MLAMDVVDTLRRRERLVRRELDEVGREEDLKTRLKRIYAQQGIDVPDHVIEQGVAALKEERFTYKPPSGGLRHKLSLWYINRARWGKWVGAAAGVAVLFFVVRYFMVVGPQNALPDELAQSHKAAVELAQTAPARERIEQLHAVGNNALRKEDTDGVKSVISQLETLRTSLEQTYALQIVSRDGQRSGVWRIPDVNSSARNYYVVVEAIDARGNILSVPIKSEETGKTEVVKQWGLRIDEATFERIRADKQDNGIIERNRVGKKKVGHLAPEYSIPTSGGAITRW